MNAAEACGRPAEHRGQRQPSVAESSGVGPRNAMMPSDSVCRQMRQSVAAADAEPYQRSAAATRAGAGKPGFIAIIHQNTGSSAA